MSYRLSGTIRVETEREGLMWLRLLASHEKATFGLHETTTDGPTTTERRIATANGGQVKTDE